MQVTTAREASIANPADTNTLAGEIHAELNDASTRPNTQTRRLMVNPWVRVDANLAANHKVLALLEQRGGDHALCVYIFGLGHSMSQNSDGFVPKVALGLFHGRQKDAQLLVGVGLWHELPGGYQIHDWADYQPTSEEAQKRADKAKRAAAARWGNVHQASDETMLQALPEHAPSNARSIAPVMPRTNVRDRRTNANQDSGLKARVPERARANRDEARRELENLERRTRTEGSGA